MSDHINNPAEIVVAGHICLDIIPTFGHQADVAMFAPGSLTRVGQAVCSTGGAVANVGLALYRLGVPVRLMGRIGKDMFGRQVIQIVNAAGNGPDDKSVSTDHGVDDPGVIRKGIIDSVVESFDAEAPDTGGLGVGLHEVPGETTSYSIVISPPGRDRFFLHCPGANDTFSSADVSLDQLAGARMFHFGYPPIMKNICQQDGRELRAIFEIARQANLATSLDMCSVDPASEAGKIDWRVFLKHVLPAVDVFLPSLDELRFMFGKPASDAAPTISELSELAGELLGYGAAVVVIKLGEHGLYVRTTADLPRLEQCPVIGPSLAGQWRDLQVIAPCFQVQLAGATGAGDCTIAGFLAAMLKGQGPQDAARSAVAVGACSVEQPDSVSGVIPWEQVQDRIACGWQRHPVTVK